MKNRESILYSTHAHTHERKHIQMQLLKNHFWELFLLLLFNFSQIPIINTIYLYMYVCAYVMCHEYVDKESASNRKWDKWFFLLLFALIFSFSIFVFVVSFCFCCCCARACVRWLTCVCGLWKRIVRNHYVHGARSLTHFFFLCFSDSLVLFFSSLLYANLTFIVI